MERDDKEIIQDIKSEKSGAVDELIVKHQKRIYHMVYGLTLDYNKAWDISQDVLVKLVKNIKDFRGDSSFTTYLYRVTMNTFYDAKRKEKSEGKVSHMSDMERADGENKVYEIKDTVNIEDTFDTKMVKEKISEALSELSATQKKVFVLKTVEGLKIKEIAKHLKLSEGTVKSHLNRGMEKIRLKMKRGGGKNE
ncbi:MAG: RNA polymerase sigma factor [bacterium]